MVCEAEQAAEKITNIAADKRKTSFRPKMSLNLAKITRTAGRICERVLVFSETGITDLRNPVGN